MFLRQHTWHTPKIFIKDRFTSQGNQVYIHGENLPSQFSLDKSASWVTHAWDRWRMSDSWDFLSLWLHNNKLACFVGLNIHRPLTNCELYPLKISCYTVFISASYKFPAYHTISISSCICTILRTVSIIHLYTGRLKNDWIGSRIG